MKRISIYILTFFSVLSLTLPVSAQNKTQDQPQKVVPVHRFGVSPKIGYAAILNNTPDAHLLGAMALDWDSTMSYATSTSYSKRE